MLSGTPKQRTHQKTEICHTDPFEFTSVNSEISARLGTLKHPSVQKHPETTGKNTKKKKSINTIINTYDRGYPPCPCQRKGIDVLQLDAATQ
jgi:hypothetical protein